MTPASPLIDRLIETLAELPGIGPKAAERIVYHLLTQPSRLRQLGALLRTLPESIRRCEQCGTFDIQSPCRICADARRDRALLCIVAHPTDLRAIEKTNEYRGIYHVLHGLLNPIEGVTPQDIAVAALLKRFGSGRQAFREVVLALNPTVEGETTSLYIAKALKPHKVRVTKLARGLPLGGELEFADEMTLGDAIRGRRDVP